MLKSKMGKSLILIGMCCFALHVAGCGDDGGGRHRGGGGGGSAPSIPWSTKQLGTKAEDIGYGIALDSSGNIYVAGSTEGDLDGNTNAGNKDIFLVKYNSSGVKQWTRQLGTAEDDIAYGIALDSGGNIYVTGSTRGDLDGHLNAGSDDIFLAKYDSSGLKQWTRLLGTTAGDIGRGVAVDGSGNAYVTGETLGSLDGQVHTGNKDIFLVKYNSSGVKQWTRLLGTGADDVGYAVALDSLGYVYMTGSTGAGLDGNPHVGQNDIFLVKYNSSGARQWTLQTGSIADDVGYAVAVDGLDNLYITGSTALGFDGSFVAGWKDVFLVKYNSSGNWQWTRLLGTIEDDIGYGVAVDGLGNVYVTGFTGLGLDGNTTNGLNDIFLAKYNSSGVKQWTQQLGTSLQDVGYAVAPDSLGNIYITGSTGGGLDGNTNVGGLDIFVVKYDSSGNLQ